MMRQAARPLVVVHYHWRSGGVRRVVETALPALARTGRFDPVVLVSGEAADGLWLDALRRAIEPVRLAAEVVPGFAYHGELKEKVTRDGLRRAAGHVLARAGAAPVVWAHNLALGRHAALAAALGDAAADGGAVFLSHHHDFFFDNRWHHRAGVEGGGFRDLPAAADAFFPRHPRTVHLCINRRDHALLARGFGARAICLPNPVVTGAVTTTDRTAARLRLEASGGTAGSCWLMPCRLMRRKNIAEGVLLARWLGENARVVTTGGPSSAAEESYASALRAAAGRAGWPLQLAVLEGGPDAPSVAALMAAADAVVSTSLHEGFGLSVHEAARLGRPVIARAAGDLAVSAPGGALVYDDVTVPDDLFDRHRERERQEILWDRWMLALPAGAASCAVRPPFLGGENAGVAFSRLTLDAQAEVLSRSTADLQAALGPANPGLASWRGRSLPATESLGGEGGVHGSGSFAARFLEVVESAEDRVLPDDDAASRVLAGFLAERLGGGNFYPLLAGPRD